VPWHTENPNPLPLPLQDLSMDCIMPRSQYGSDRGVGTIARMLRWDTQRDAANITELDYTDGLLFRTFFVNNTDATSGMLGSISFVDCAMFWVAGNDAKPVPVAAIVVPVVAGVLLLAAALTGLVMWRRRRGAGGGDMLMAKGGYPLLPGPGGTTGDDGKPDPKGANNGSNLSSDNGIATISGASNASPPSGGYEGFAVCERERSETSRSTSTGAGRSGPSQDIQEACRSLSHARMGTDGEPVMLQSVLGEGSYGKVRAVVLVLARLGGSTILRPWMLRAARAWA
jgi:hypothetical protein